MQNTLKERQQHRKRKILQRAIDEYFASCIGPLIGEAGEVVCNSKTGEPCSIERPPTISGLALCLGMDRNALLCYKGPYSCIIAPAVNRVHAFTEEQLYDKTGSSGAKFSLTNNFGWTEKREEIGTVVHIELAPELEAYAK